LETLEVSQLGLECPKSWEFSLGWMDQMAAWLNPGELYQGQAE
jgi:hypothetical protein